MNWIPSVELEIEFWNHAKPILTVGCGTVVYTGLAGAWTGGTVPRHCYDGQLTLRGRTKVPGRSALDQGTCILTWLNFLKTFPDELSILKPLGLFGCLFFNENSCETSFRNDTSKSFLANVREIRPEYVRILSHSNPLLYDLTTFDTTGFLEAFFIIT